MKKVISLLLVLTAGNAVASSLDDFSAAISTSVEALAQSKNYKAVYVNDDQTVTIAEPKFSNPDGSGALYLSGNSDYNGVCKLYGYDTFVPNSYIRKNAGNSDRNVVIGANSSFSRFETNDNVYVIGSLTCTQVNQPSIPISSNYGDRYSNDDGSVTIKSPKFNMNGQAMSLSGNSDYNGVCKLYGYGTFVPNSYIRKNAGNSDRNVVIGANSSFSRFETNDNVYVIGSLICR